MKRVFVSALLVFLSWNANALEVVGVKVPEKMQSGEQALVLNGAGSRFMAGVIDVYVIALYLPENKHTVAEVLEEERSKNVTIWFLTPLGVKVTSEQLLDATHKLMSENMSAEELTKLDSSWKKFAAFFDNIKEFKKEDQLSLDYQPNKEMRVSMNGKELGRVAGADFMRAFLLVWLGAQPAQDDLKGKLLGLPLAAAKR
ncbi:MAG: lipoprotein [Gallionellaceae bacterium]|nr:MAG: lipoprotein [Gallionellaceae bacterium]